MFVGEMQDGKVCVCMYAHFANYVFGLDPSHAMPACSKSTLFTCLVTFNSEK